MHVILQVVIYSFHLNTQMTVMRKPNLDIEVVEDDYMNNICICVAVAFSDFPIMFIQSVNIPAVLLIHANSECLMKWLP